MVYRKILGSKIHRATVTGANVDYEGSITIPHDLMEQANLIANEAICVWNVTSGSRLETYVIPAERNSGHICINGAAAHLAKKGDIVILAKFLYISNDEVLAHHPTVVFVDSQNRITEVRGERANFTA